MISESMKKKYFDRWTDSSYGNDVITTSIGYNYIDNQEDCDAPCLWYSNLSPISSMEKAISTILKCGQISSTAFLGKVVPFVL